VDINTHVKCDTNIIPVIRRNTDTIPVVRRNNDIRRVNPNDDIRNADGYGERR